MRLPRHPGALRVLAFGALFFLASGFAMSIASAASKTFTVTIPSFGSTTDPQQYVTVDNSRNIDLKYASNPADTEVKPVKCSSGADISGKKLIRAGDHTRKTLATNVILGTCYKLNFDTPGCCSSVTVSGTTFF